MPLVLAWSPPTLTVQQILRSFRAPNVRRSISPSSPKTRLRRHFIRATQPDQRVPCAITSTNSSTNSPSPKTNTLVKLPYWPTVSHSRRPAETLSTLSTLSEAFGQKQKCNPYHTVESSLPTTPSRVHRGPSRRWESRRTHLTHYSYARFLA